MKRSFEKQTICLNQSLIIMLINSILIPCATVCPHAYIRDAATMKNFKNSMQGKFEFVPLQIWSCHNFKQPDLNIKLRATTLQENRKKLIASVFMVIATIVRLFLKQWVVFFFHFCPCQEETLCKKSFKQFKLG